jgi:Helix-turn-helix domain
MPSRSATSLVDMTSERVSGRAAGEAIYLREARSRQCGPPGPTSVGASCLSVEQLAEAARFHPRSIDRMESALTEPSLTTLVSLAKAFGLSVAALVERGALDATETE